MLQRAPEAVEMNIDGALVVVDPATNQMLTLNPVAALIWNALETPTDLDAVVAVCTTEFADVAVARIRADIASFIEHAQSLGVVTKI